VGADLITLEGGAVLARITARLGRLEAHKRQPGTYPLETDTILLTRATQHASAMLSGGA